MAATAGRIICGRCGANNFGTQAACWKCSSPLSAVPSPAALPVQAPRQAQPPSAIPQPNYAPVSDFRPDPSVAIWAGIALAILFPYVAVPVGIVFLMLDDRRKIEIGRVTLIWGIVSSILQILLTVWLSNVVIQQSVGGVMQGINRARAAASGDGDAPRLTMPQKIPMPGSRNAPSIPEVPPYDNVPFPEVPKSVTSPR